MPVVLSPDEVQRPIAHAKNLYHRTLLLTLYGAGLRRSELCQLKVRDIDSQRMVLRVEQGKGGRDREIPLSPTLLAALREYYRFQEADEPLLSVRKEPLRDRGLRLPVKAFADQAELDTEALRHNARRLSSAGSRHAGFNGSA